MYAINYVEWEELMLELPEYYGAYYRNTLSPGSMAYSTPEIITGVFNYVVDLDENENPIPILHTFSPAINQTIPASELVLFVTAQDAALNSVTVIVTDVTENSFMVSAAVDCRISFLLSLKNTE